MWIAEIIEGTLKGLGGGKGLAESYRETRDRMRKKDILRSALMEDGYDWRTGELLRTRIKSDSITTEQLLRELKARPSDDGQDLWTLKK